MNAPRPNLHPDVEEQAALWAARLDGDVLDAPQRQALDAWLAESPLHRTVLSQYCQLSTDLEEQIPQLVARGGLFAPAPAEPVAGKRASAGRVTSILLAAAAAVVLGLWFLKPASGVENLATSVAQRQTHTLADGTRVDLNAHTSLRFENMKTERRIRLASGEALFTVTKDATRPFLVDTPAGSIRVTGTTFNVRLGLEGALEVTVVEGSVEVSPGESTVEINSQPVALVANEQLSIGREGLQQRMLSASTRDDALAWRQGRIVFTGTPLIEAVGRFARYHGRGMKVDRDVANERVGGQYSLDDLRGFLSGIQAVVPVTVRQDMGGTIYVDPRPRPERR